MPVGGARPLGPPLSDVHINGPALERTLALDVSLPSLDE